MKRAPITLPQPPVDLSASSPSYPEMLRELPDPPKFLRVVGDWPLPDAARVGVVGTRHADPDALEFTHRLAADLALAGAIVISGGARGVDTAAHRGALSVGGFTIAVLATGLSHAYPPENAELFSEIAVSGCLLTEAADGWAPHPGLFLHRNRVIAALSDVLVVVQAPARSGALSTARQALSLGRRVYAVPDAPWKPRAAGCLGLLRRGATICTSARDILIQRPAGLGEGGEPTVENGIKPSIYSRLGTLGQGVVALLGDGPLTPEQVGRQLDIPINHVQEVLLTLELSGCLEHRMDGRYAVAAKARGG